MASITSYTKAEIDEQLGTKAATADLGTAATASVGDFATAAQGSKADASDVAAITLTAPLALTIPAGFPAGQVYRVTLTQDGTGGHTVTYGGQPVTVGLTAGAATAVELHPAGAGHVVRYPAPPVGTTAGTIKPGDWTPVVADLTDSTAAGRALLTGANPAAQRASLGLGTAATTSAADYTALAPNPAPPRNLAITDYIYDQGTVLDSGDSTGAWTMSGTGTLTDDTTYYRTGGHGLRMTITSGTFLQIDKTISINFGTQPAISFWVYLHDTNVSSITCYITSAGLGVSYFLATIDPSALWYRTPGWNLVTIPPTYAWANTGGESWTATATKIRIKVNAKTGTLPVVTVDDVRYNVRAEPKAIITFDDAHHTVYDTAFPIMREMGIPGVIYTNGSRVGTTNYMTVAQLTEVHRAGWDVANHGYAHINYTGLSQAAIETDIGDNITWLEAHGFARAARHFAIPNSLYSAESRGAGDALGLYTMRRAGNRNVVVPQVDLRSMPSLTVLNTTPLATLKGWFDAAHMDGQTAVYMFHQVADVATDTYDYPTADFSAFVRYIYDLVLEDSVVTMSRWWRGLNRAATQIAP